MQKSKLRFVVAALAALAAELFGPALSSGVHVVAAQAVVVSHTGQPR